MEAVQRGLDLAGTLFAGSPKEIFIVGTAHEAYQIRPQGAPADGVDAFKAELDEIVRQYHPTVIAEEMNLEALNGRRTVCQEIATAQGLDHIFCDPDRREREMLGIAQNDHSVNRQRREAEWAHRLQKNDARRLLFVCGAIHVESFAKLCRDIGWNPQIICEDFRADIPLDRRII